jgi:hypothetical protein
MMIRTTGVLAISLLAACTIPAETAPESPATSTSKADPKQDTLRLNNGGVVQGRIVEETPRSVTIDRGDCLSTYPKAAIASIDYSKERAAAAALAPSEPVPMRPPNTWLPRRHEGEAAEQTEVLFYDKHDLKDCLGEGLAESHVNLPDVALFADPGGKIRIQDPRRWGYHVHLAAQGLRVPVGKPGLTLDVPKDEARWPEWLSVVSPAQEVKVVSDGEKEETRRSYAIPDAVLARLRPLSGADAMLAAQPFSGGKASKTPNGTLWAFTLPRNHRQFLVFLLDPERRHGEILNSSYIGYGDTLLAADLMIDTVGADGVTRGRVLVVPYPDGIAPDGPGVEPLVVYAGPVTDPTTVARLALPPRESLQLPPRAASTRADLLVSHYDVSRAIPQSIVVAHGTGRPTRGVTRVSRELTAETPDEVVKIDLTALPEDQFPAVAWMYQRRSYHWRWTGGMLAEAAPQEVPAAPAVITKLTRVKRHDSIAHVLPLLFTGPKPPAASAAAARRGPSPLAAVAGGMATALLRDSLSRGGDGGSTAPLTPVAAPSGPGTDGGTISNVTYVYITAPPHMPSGGYDAPRGGGGGGGMSGLYQYTSGSTGVFTLPGSTSAARHSAYGGYGTYNAQSGTYTNQQGQVTYDPATGQTTQQSQPEMYMSQNGQLNFRMRTTRGGNSNP